VGAYGYVLSSQTLNVAASRGPGSRGTYPVLENPRRGLWGPGCMPNRGVRIRQVGLTGGKILPTRGYGDGGKD
jgi:hypothetical protein